MKRNIQQTICPDTLKAYYPHQWNKKPLIVESIFWAAFISSSLYLISINLDFLFPIGFVIIVYFMAFIGRINSAPESLPYSRPPSIEANIYGINWPNCRDNKIYGKAVIECADELRSLKDNFNAKPWSETFVAMNNEIKLQKKREKEKASEIPRTDWVEELKLSNKLINGEQILINKKPLE